jgi:hypothetical protein
MVRDQSLVDDLAWVRLRYEAHCSVDGGELMDYSDFRSLLG